MSWNFLQNHEIAEKPSPLRRVKVKLLVSLCKGTIDKSGK